MMASIGMVATTIRVAATNFGVMLRSSICGDSLVVAIAGIGVAVSG